MSEEIKLPFLHWWLGKESPQPWVDLIEADADIRWIERRMLGAEDTAPGEHPGWSEHVKVSGLLEPNDPELQNDGNLMRNPERARPDRYHRCAGMLRYRPHILRGLLPIVTVDHDRSRIRRLSTDDGSQYIQQIWKCDERSQERLRAYAWADLGPEQDDEAEWYASRDALLEFARGESFLAANRAELREVVLTEFPMTKKRGRPEDPALEALNRDYIKRLREGWYEFTEDDPKGVNWYRETRARELGWKPEKESTLMSRLRKLWKKYGIE